MIRVSRSRSPAHPGGAAVAALDEPVATALAAEGRAMGWDAARVEALAASYR